MQEWETRDHLVRFLRSKAYRQILELMELSTAAPDVKFFEVGQFEGLELVEEARLGA